MHYITKLKKTYYTNKKASIIIGGIILLALMIAMTCAFNGHKNIKVVVEPNTANAEDTQETVVSAALQSTVEEVLADENYTYEEGYSLNVPEDEVIQDLDEPIVIKKNAQGTIHVDGQDVTYDSGADTVGDLLSEQNITFDDNDEITPGVGTTLTVEVSDITIVRVEIKEETRQEAVPFTTEVQNNMTLQDGVVNVLTPGADGEQEVVDEVTYHDGEEVARSNVSTTVTKAAVNQVEEHGILTAEAAAAGATGGYATQTPADMDLICAIVAHEGGTSYEGAMAVISCVMNRSDSGAWGGTDAVDILTASGQFESYLAGYYTQYLGADIPEVRQAVTDCMEKGFRTHPYERFRSYETTGSVQIAGGNWFF